MRLFYIRIGTRPNINLFVLYDDILVKRIIKMDQKLT